MIDALYKPPANGKDDGIIRELLIDFFKTSNGREPTQIIVFRYQRSTTAISIVAPICYAHLAAAQVGQFMKFEDISDTSSGKGSVTSSETIPGQELPRLHEKVQGFMFFC